MTGPAPCLEVNSAGIGNVQASSILGKVFGLHNDKICIKIKQKLNCYIIIPIFAKLVRHDIYTVQKCI